MKLSNLALKIALATALGTASWAAQAGATTVTNKNIAVESFGTAYVDTTALVNGATILYAPTAVVALGANQSYVSTFTLPTGVKWNAVPTITAFTGAGGAGAVAGTTTTTGVLNAAGNVLTVLTNATVADTIGSIVIANTAAFNSVKSSLSAVGGTVTVTAAGTQYGGAGGTGIALGTDAATAVTIFTGAAGLTSALAATTDTKVVDVQNASSNGKKFTTQVGGSTPASNLLLNLGNVTFTNVAAVNQATATPTTTAYTVAANAAGTGAAGLVVTVNPNGASWPTGSSLQLTSDLACATGVSTAVTTAGAANVVLNLTAAAAAATAYQVCLTVTGTADIPVFTPMISAVLNKSVATDTTNTLAAANGYAITSNGKTAFADNFIASSNAPGYYSVLRFINTGSIDAAPTVVVMNSLGVQVGNSGVLATMKANGGALNYTSAQIETAIGTVLPVGNYRVKVTAPTGGLRLQHYINTPNGLAESSGFANGL